MLKLKKKTGMKIEDLKIFKNKLKNRTGNKINNVHQRHGCESKIMQAYEFRDKGLLEIQD